MATTLLPSFMDGEELKLRGRGAQRSSATTLRNRVKPISERKNTMSLGSTMPFRKGPKWVTKLKLETASAIQIGKIFASVSVKPLSPRKRSTAQATRLSTKLMTWFFVSAEV